MSCISTKRGTGLLACAVFAPIRNCGGRNAWAAVALTCSLTFTSCAKRYAAEGLILRVERERKTVTISHREIPGYMAAMAMPFRVKDAAQLDGLVPGTRVDFQIEVTRRGALVRNLRTRALAPDSVVADDGRRLRLPPTPDKLAIGAAVPDFTLTDQSFRQVQLTDFRNQVVALNFIYTRCPLPARS
jgi:protein SCO1